MGKQTNFRAQDFKKSKPTPVKPLKEEPHAESPLIENEEATKVEVPAGEKKTRTKKAKSEDEY